MKKGLCLPSFGIIVLTLFLAGCGTPLALAWAAQIPLNMDVFAQNAGATAIDDTTDNTGGTILDDSANRISGDDNQSASDLAETVT